VTHIADLLATGPTYSFEFFPPKNDAELNRLARTLRDLEPLAPSFVSVTYRGGSESRRRTFDLVSGVLHTTALTPMAHLVCVAHTRLELAEILVSYRRAGVENLMALGGDQPADPSHAPSELSHAIELVELARAIGGFSIGVAAHPAGHPSSSSMAADRDHLAAKLEIADFACTQFFFTVAEYETLVNDLATRGVLKPVLPGIMPVTSLSSIDRMASMGAAVPEWMVARLVAASADGPEAVRAEGIALATELCRQLIAAGAPGLHFYTLNQSRATRDIYEALDLGPALRATG
jgi:methylenetetrahydrofolate reductase (NADPH)